MVRRIMGGELGIVDVAGARRHQRRGRRPAMLLVAALVMGAGVATASQLLGGSAPPQVKKDLADIDRGMPSDLRYDPNVSDARLVAQADGASLYYASLADGGYCYEIVAPSSGPGGAICAPMGTLGQEPIHVTSPFVDPVTKSSPFVVGGRVNVVGATALEASFIDGFTQQISLGENGFFVFAVSADRLVEAHLHGVRMVAMDATGKEIASVEIPPTDFGNPAKQDARQPIFVSTVSTQNDLTKVLGVEGSVNVSGAASLELRYPDGTVTQIPITVDGRYRYDLPRERTGDLFTEPGWLTARDGAGHELAKVPVAAVAYWRSNR